MLDILVTFETFHEFIAELNAIHPENAAAILVALETFQLDTSLDQTVQPENIELISVIEDVFQPLKSEVKAPHC